MDITRLQKAMGVEALVADANGGIYMVASMVEALDQSLASVEHLQATLDAKAKEIEELNGMIAGLKTSHEEALAAKDAEIEAAKAEHQTEADETVKAENETLKAENENLKAEKESLVAENEGLKTQLAAKDEEIESIKKDNESLKATLAEKDAEIEELSQASNQAPASPAAPASNATAEQKEDHFKVQSIVTEGMSLSEREKAYKERMALLKRERFK